jgi:two-component system, cell cycle response regulator
LSAEVHADPEASPALTILLAEDDPVTRMLMSRQLKAAGYEVDAVADGRAALQKIGERYYPILITDWEMPELDGISLCKAMRAMKLDGYMYALLLTARDSSANIITGLESGADDYLTKPVNEAELLARLNTARRILALEQSLRTANQTNRLLSITDVLTGAFNRRFLMEQLPREIERCRRYGRGLSVIMCDIDHFKKVNDTLGHEAGDAVLKQFTERVMKFTRSTSDWLARYGGEEFVIVLPETAHAGGLQAAEKIRAAIAAAAFVTATGELAITASFGIASFSSETPEADITVDALIRTADACLYESKAAGRNRVTGSDVLVADRRAARSDDVA